MTSIIENTQSQNYQEYVKLQENLKIFPSYKKPVIVINAGGFSTTNFFDEAIKNDLYERVGKSIAEVNQDGIEIIIQTMPPFPWHFGGQSFHNLFVSSDEIVTFCEKFQTRICLDISHSKMACSYYNWDFNKFVERVAPYVAHLHIVDAKGTMERAYKLVKVMLILLSSQKF